MNKKELVNIVVERLEAEKLSLTSDWESQTAIFAKTIVLDDLLPEEFLKACFQKLESVAKWKISSDFRESKGVIQNIDQLGKKIVDILEVFHAPEIVSLIEQITQIKGLTCDRSLYAGGISRMVKNDFLNPHIDNSHNRDRTLYRRLNLLFYITPDLIEADGAKLQLWDETVQNCRVVPSQFNRLVIMETARHTWHSVSPVVGNISRYCVSNYYFSKSCPELTDYFNVTSFMGRPEQKFLRAFSFLDNFSRQMASKFMSGRGEKRGRDIDV